MVDVVVTFTNTPKYPQAILKANTAQGVVALSEAHGSKCTSIVIARRRLNYAKDFLTKRGCSVAVANEKTSRLFVQPI